MTAKLTMLIQQSSAISSPGAPVHRIGGWSESWFYSGTIAQAILNAQGLSISGGGATIQGGGLLASRARLLSLGANIVGIRVQNVSPPSSSQTLAVNYPGSSNLTGPGGTFAKSDMPQSALLCTALALGFSNVRRFTLRGVPDDVVIEGEFNQNPVFLNDLNNFFQSLNIWQFRGRDLNQQVNPILQISAAGVVTAAQALTYNLLDFVRVLKTRDVSGFLRGGRFQVSAIGPGSNQVTLFAWPFGLCTGGSLRKDTGPQFFTVDTANTRVSRVVVRKVGRPFTQYRGRRSRRR